MKELLAGKEFTVPMYIHVSERFGSCLEKEPIVFSCDMSNHGYINLCAIDFTFTLPENVDPVAKALESLEKQITNERANFQHKIDALEEKKQQLLAIGYDKPVNDFINDTIDDQ